MSTQRIAKAALFVALLAAGLVPSAQALAQTPARPLETERSIRVSDIEITGVTVEALRAPVDAARAGALEAAAARGGVWRVSDVLALRDAVTQAYIDRGYLNSGATVPRQDLSDGVLTVEVIEGRLTEVSARMITPSILGSTATEAEHQAARAADPEVKRPSFFAADRAPDDDSWRPFQLRRGFVRRALDAGSDAPLNAEDLRERFQLLVSDPAIRRADARIEPGDAPGEGRIALNVEEAPPLRLSVTAASDRAPSIGGERVSAQGALRNLLGLGDVLSGELGGSRGVFDGDFSYDLPLAPGGLTLHAYTDFSEAEIIEDPLSDLDIFSSSLTYGGGASFPFLNGVLFDDETGAATTYALRLRGDVARKRTETELLGIPFDFSPGSVDGEAELTVAALALEADLRSTNTVLVARAAYNLGLEGTESPIAGAPPQNFRYVQIQAQAAHLLFEELEHQLIGRIDFQEALDTLYAAERYSFGGVDSVRGYRVSAVTVDSALVGSLEYRAGLGPIGREFGTRFFDRWSLGAFVDVGEGWNRDLQEPINNRLLSVGAQLNFGLFDRIQGSVYYGEALEEVFQPDDDTLQDSGFGFRLTVRGF